MVRGMTSRKHGVVYIAQRVLEFESSTEFYGHWEPAESETIESGPGWDDPESAIAWGRERAPVVLIRIGQPPQQHYSAGETFPAGRPPEGGVLQWSERDE
jgi:hypothetical protein